jgi:hypothetical protein
VRKHGRIFQSLCSLQIRQLRLSLGLKKKKMTMNFELEEDLWWQTKANLPSWSGFQSRGGPYGSNDSESPSNGDVIIVFAPEGRDIEPLNDEEIKSVE